MYRVNSDASPSAIVRRAAERTTPEEMQERLAERESAMPLERYGHRVLLPRLWELRANASAYDASYLALAEALEAPLLTRDAALASVPGFRARVDVV